ncbi:MAG: SOS response-associated peptidase [Bacteroidales bacterium]|nr:SOS response-associated peptidase [Bacteroidales bacterium]
MCGRFSFTARRDDVENRFGVFIDTDAYIPRYNCAPSQKLSVISNASPEKLSFYRWGLIPFWAKDFSIGNKMINARAESIIEKPSFKNSFRRKRCLVLSDGFYEWKKEEKVAGAGAVAGKKEEKVPYRILKKDNSLFAMAGLWDTWKDAEGRETQSFTIITTSANDLIKDIHHRMPVILQPEHERLWLDEFDKQKHLELLKPYPSELMKTYRVSKLVNSPLNDNKELIQPLINS